MYCCLLKLPVINESVNLFDLRVYFSSSNDSIFLVSKGEDVFTSLPL